MTPADPDTPPPAVPSAAAPPRPAWQRAPRWLAHWMIVSLILWAALSAAEKVMVRTIDGAGPRLRHADTVFVNALARLQPFGVAATYVRAVEHEMVPRDLSTPPQSSSLGTLIAAAVGAFPLTVRAMLSQGTLQGVLAVLVLLAGAVAMWNVEGNWFVRLVCVPLVGSLFVLPFWLLAKVFALALHGVVAAPGVVGATGPLGGAMWMVGRAAHSGVEHEAGSRIDDWVTRRLKI